MRNKHFKNIFMTVFLMGIFGLGFYGGYNHYSDAEEIIEKTQNDEIDFDIESVSKTKEDKITPSTKMVYKYFYENSDITEEVEDVPPYYLIDATRDELISNYADWQIESFSDKEVVMSRKISKEVKECFTIGVYNGFVAVYYDEGIDSSKILDITSTPIISLPKEEQDKLKEGINVKGQTQLIKCLENYDV